jgi:hypothetical protein
LTRLENNDTYNYPWKEQTFTNKYILIVNYDLPLQNQTIPKHTDKDTCYSGGAEGADEHWAKNAVSVNHFVKVMSFEGHKPRRENSVKFSIVKVDKESLNNTIPLLEEANQYLKRSINFDKSIYTKRDCKQVEFSNSLYVMSRQEPTNAKNGSVNLKGGSAWATQIFVIRWVYKNADFKTGGMKKLPAYLYDLGKDKWFQGKVTYDTDATLLNFGWIPMDSLPPKPSGLYTGIGAREFTERGKTEIKKLFNQ